MRSKVVFTPEEALQLYGARSTLEEPVELLREQLTEAGIYAHCLDPQRAFILSEQAPDGELLGHDDWNRLDISQNLPQVFLPLYEVLIPQSLNLDLIGAVNFKKGCYPGQEIIARVKYRGKPKTRMITASCADCEGLEPGAAVYIEDRERAAGHIVNLEAVDAGVQLIITVPVTHLQEGTVYLDEARSISVNRLASPYEISA